MHYVPLFQFNHFLSFSIMKPPEGNAAPFEIVFVAANCANCIERRYMCS